MPGRPRLFVVAHSLVAADGGMETVHVRLIEQMLDDYEVHALSRRLDPGLVGRVAFHRVPVPSSPAPLRFASFFVVASAMLMRLRRSGDVVHSCGAIVANPIDVASIHTLSAAIVAERGGHLAPTSLPLLRRINSGLLRWLALRAERLCYRPRRLRVAAAVSAATAAEVESFYPGLPVAITPNGVDPGRYHPDPEVRRQVRDELGIDEEAVVACFVGGDFERKGLGIAIDALVHAPGVVLVVAGSGDLDRARSHARAAGVAGRVHLLGPRSDVERIDQAADVYLGCSDYEADSLALLEAAASGLALVSTRAGSAEAFIGSGEQACGILVERGAEAVGAALAELAGAPERRAEMGRRALAASAQRTWAASARAVEALYAAG